MDGWVDRQVEEMELLWHCHETKCELSCHQIELLLNNFGQHNGNQIVCGGWQIHRRLVWQRHHLCQWKTMWQTLGSRMLLVKWWIDWGQCLWWMNLRCTKWVTKIKTVGSSWHWSRRGVGMRNSAHLILGMKVESCIDHINDGANELRRLMDERD